MQSTAIFGPFFATMALTFAVWLTMFARRVPFILSSGMTQEQMAKFVGTSTSGYRKWEQGSRAPNGAARTLLRVMEREPEAVLRALTR